MSEAVANPREFAKRSISALEGFADVWAAEVKLHEMIRNAIHVARLGCGASDEVQEKFIARSQAQIDAIVRQAFIEGACQARAGTTHAFGSNPPQDDAPVLRDALRGLIDWVEGGCPDGGRYTMVEAKAALNGMRVVCPAPTQPDPVEPDRAQLEAIGKLHAALIEQHKWHLQEGEDEIEGVPGKADKAPRKADAYANSVMCRQTIEALDLAERLASDPSAFGEQDRGRALRKRIDELRLRITENVGE